MNVDVLVSLVFYRGRGLYREESGEKERDRENVADFDKNLMDPGSSLL